MEARDYLDLTKYRRIIKLATTPSMDEFEKVSLISGAGIVIAGVIGFLIFVIMTILPT